MRNGFTFNGTHTSSFEGVTARTVDRPIFPQVKEMVQSAAEMDGEYDFTDVSGREYFNTRTFQVEFGVTADNLQQLQKRMTALSRFFKGRGTLIFDDIPTVRWNVRVMDSVSYMPEHGGHKAVLSVSYKAMPFSELVWDLIEGPCLDDELVLDTDYPIGGAEEYFTLGGTTAYKNVPNVGDVSVKPVITVTAIGDTPFTPMILDGEEMNVVSISSGGRRIIVRSPEDNIKSFVIDCEKEIVYSGTSSLMPYVSGEFIELNAGSGNKMTLFSQAVVQISYVPKFLYDADMENVDWGDDDA